MCLSVRAELEHVIRRPHFAPWSWKEIGMQHFSDRPRCCREVGLCEWQLRHDLSQGVAMKWGIRESNGRYEVYGPRLRESVVVCENQLDAKAILLACLRAFWGRGTETLEDVERCLNNFGEFDPDKL